MVQLQTISIVFAGLSAVQALPISNAQTPPCDLSNPSCGPVPEESDIYNNYTGKEAPFPGNSTGEIGATTLETELKADDLLFQNLLAAEWIIYSFYQTAVETFNASSFTAMGLPNNTSVKPGPCKYENNLTTPEFFLAVQQLIEITSEAFLTGLVLQAKLDETKSAMVAIGGIEARHSAWALIDVWGAEPFTGPAETIFPYANEILDVTNQFVVPGSCPKENPVYPRPGQNLPRMNFDSGSTTARPGANITFTFSKAPQYQKDKEYYAVFYHGLQKVSVPFDVQTNRTTIPAAFDSKGLILVVIADTPGTPYTDTVIAGPLTLLEQPSQVTLAFGN